MKEVCKIIVAVIIGILIVLGMLYVIDINRMKQNKPVFFSTWGRDYAPPVKESHENKNTQEIEEYSEKKAIDEGWIVITNDKKIYNKGNLNRFIKNTDINAENRKEDSIKIVQYTMEGDPIITELSYKIKDETYLFKGEQVNKTTYILKVDNTRDRFAADRKITIDDDIPGDFFSVVEEKDGDSVKINLALCAIIEYATKDAKQYKEINVCSYPKDSKAVQEFPYFYGTVIESKANNIIVEPREGENIRKSADKISIDLGKHSDVVYMVGTNVKINYDGSIKESYPVQVPNAIIYKDGGSMEYHYKDYTIIKCHTEAGNRDVYIGEPKLNINDLKL